MRQYETLSEAINDLVKRGYNTDFNLTENCLICQHDNKEYTPENFEVAEVYRFEGMNNPDDSSILYAIETKDGAVKGTLVNAYGAYADSMSADMVAKLTIKH